MTFIEAAILFLIATIISQAAWYGHRMVKRLDRMDEKLGNLGEEVSFIRGRMKKDDRNDPE